MQQLQVGQSSRVQVDKRQLLPSGCTGRLAASAEKCEERPKPVGVSYCVYEGEERPGRMWMEEGRSRRLGDSNLVEKADGWMTTNGGEVRRRLSVKPAFSVGRRGGAICVMREA